MATIHKLSVEPADIEVTFCLVKIKKNTGLSIYLKTSI